MPDFELLPCRPMHARVTRRGCVENHDSGRHWQCNGCPLGPSRGARKEWIPEGHDGTQGAVALRRDAYRGRAEGVVEIRSRRASGIRPRVSDLTPEYAL